MSKGTLLNSKTGTNVDSKGVSTGELAKHAKRDWEHYISNFPGCRNGTYK